MTDQIRVEPQAVWDRVVALSRHGAVGETGVSRLVYSPEWRAAQDELARWWAEIGLDVRMDAVGNLWGRLAGSEAGPSIVSGSHVDSQDPGGRFDGALGIISATMAVAELKRRYGTPKRTLEVVSLAEEESSRFPAAGFWGSRGITGRIAPGDLESVVSFAGEKIGDVMVAAGFDPARVGDAIRDDLGCFVELHIEQGPLLEAEGLPLGIVRAITGIRHTVVTVEGTSNHAGAFPMDGRRDPMRGAAEMIAALVATAEAWGRPAVTTVGRIHAEPNYPAIVPDRVSFTIDARHPDPARRLALYAAHEATVERIARERDLQVSLEFLSEHAPYTCDPALVATFEGAARRAGLPFQTMTSGAVHDTQRMAAKCPGVMLFVRSKDGRSHTPAEYSSPEDCALGVQLLAEGLRDLAY
jgi:allantoate deiminase